MSSLTGSVIRYLERILREFESGVVKLKLSIPSVVEFILVKSVHHGDLFIDYVVYFIKRFSKIANLLQISMLDSMIIVSIWFGALTLLLMLIVIVMLH